MTELSYPKCTARLQSLGTSKPGGLHPAPNARLSSWACSVLGLSQTVVNGKQHLGVGEGKALPARAVPKMEGLETQRQPGPMHQSYPNHRTTTTEPPPQKQLEKNSKAERG